MLLEVLISIAIMVLAIATIGSQVSQSLTTAAYTDKLNRALMLAEWALAEMDLATDDEDRLIDLRGEEGEGTFGEQYPGFGWRIVREPTDVVDLDLITLEILTGNPEEDSVDDWKVLHSVYAFRPVVAEVDPTDFGMPSEEEIGLLAAATPPEAGSPGEGTDDTSAAIEELLAALPAPLQEILQRLLAGEAVPLDEIRMAYGELTTEDILGMMTSPVLLGMLGGNLGGLSNGLLSGQGPKGFQLPLPGIGGASDQASQGGAGGSFLQQQLQNLMPGR